MPRFRRVLPMLTAAGLLLAGPAATASAGPAASAGPTASAGPAARSAASTRALPAHLFAPYFETYADTQPAARAAASGVRYLTLAFLETPRPGSCRVVWNGDRATPVSHAVLGAGIAALRRAGGDVVPSFGGYSADHERRDIADSCTSVPAIARAYESVLTTYGVSRLDLDVEDRSLRHPAAVDRRNAAIARVQRWAARRHRRAEFVYTVPTTTAGLEPDALRVLRSARSAGATVRAVNVMTFDYYDGARHEMAADTARAAAALHRQLAALHPGTPAVALWHRIGVTEMVGIDDYGPAETFAPADARRVAAWASARGLAELSFWALQRDRGGCPGTAGRDDCSGVAQHDWQFSHILRQFTGGTP